MVFGRDDKVMHSCFFGIQNPFFRIKFQGIKFMGKLKISRPADLFLSHQVLGITAYHLSFPFPFGHRIQAPVHKHSKLSLLPPLNALLMALHRFGPPTRSGNIYSPLITLSGLIKHFFIFITRHLAITRSGNKRKREE
ncbi:hypothetical protein D3C86_1739440 [compost metagenome]